MKVIFGPTNFVVRLTCLKKKNAHIKKSQWNTWGKVLVQSENEFFLPFAMV